MLYSHEICQKLEKVRDLFVEQVTRAEEAHDDDLIELRRRRELVQAIIDLYY